MARIKPAKFDEQLTLVEHLDELRTRIVVSGIVLAVACGLAFWQNDLLLDIANEPLPDDRMPVTFSPTEPLFTTVKLSVYAGLMLALPLILYQAYAFVLPAFSPREKRAVLPFLFLIPVLFVGGVVFSYFAVLPLALDFLLSFNESQFDIELRASEYYGFFILAVMSLGLLFQIPIGVLAVTRLEIVTPEQLARQRRYAVLVIAVLAMLLTPPDPVTMLITMGPLILLFEFSLVLARVFGRPPGEEAEAGAEESEAGAQPGGAA